MCARPRVVERGLDCGELPGVLGQRAEPRLSCIQCSGGLGKVALPPAIQALNDLRNRRVVRGSTRLPRVLQSTLHESADGFNVQLSNVQILVVVTTVVLLGIFTWLVAKTRLGRDMRACEQDQTMAALLGVDVDRTISMTFVIGAALAAVAGMMYLLYYGLVDFFMGFVAGIKAFTAAVLGGIGSLPGAMLGGLLISASRAGLAATGASVGLLILLMMRGLWRARPDLFHAPHYVLPPLTPGKTVVTIHDCIHLRFPQYLPNRMALTYALRYGTIPIVRATGGLVDTVVDATPEALASGRASGFVFEHADGNGLASWLDAMADEKIVSLRCVISTSLSLMCDAVSTPLFSAASAAAPISTSPSPVLQT